MLLDVLAMISELCLFFQKTNIDLAGIDSAVTGVENDLKDYKRGTLERPTYFDEIDTELTQEQGKYVFKGTHVMKMCNNINTCHKINPHPVIRGLWGPGMHENCHYLKIYLNLVLGFHVILKDVAWYHYWLFLYPVGELKNNYLEFNVNCT